MPEAPRSPTRQAGPGRPLRRPPPLRPPPSGAQQAMAEGLAWDYHVGRLFENIEKDIGVESRRWIAFGGPDPVRQPGYLWGLAEDVGLEKPPGGVWSVNVPLPEERKQFLAVAEDLNKDRGAGWDDQRDQGKNFFERKVHGRGKYQIMLTTGQLINPAEWGNLISSNTESLAYQALYYAIEGYKYRDLVSSGRTLGQTVDDLIRLQRETTGQIGEVRSALTPSVRGTTVEELQKEEEKFAKWEAEERKRWEKEHPSQALGAQTWEELRQERVAAGAEIGKLDADRQKFQEEMRGLKVQERAEVESALGKEGTDLLERNEAAARDIANLDRDLSRIRGEGDVLSGQRLAAQKKLTELNVSLTAQGLTPEEVAGRLASSPESAEVLRLNQEVSSKRSQFQSVSQKRNSLESEASSIRGRLSQINPDYGKVRAGIGQKFDRQRRGLRDQLLEVQLRRRDWSDRETTAGRLEGLVAAREIAVKKRIIKKIDGRLEQFNPGMREWFAPRAQGQHLFNGFDWDRETGGWKRSKTTGRVWQLEDFLHDPIGYSFRSFVWKGDPLPGGHKLFNIVRVDEGIGKGKIFVRWGGNGLRQGESFVGSGLRNLLLGNSEKGVGPLMNLVKSGSAGADLSEALTKGFLDPRKYQAYGRYLAKISAQIFKAMKFVIQWLLNLVSKVLPHLLGLVGAGGGGAAVTGAGAGTAALAGTGVGAAGAGGGLVAEEVATGVATGGVKPAAEVGAAALVIAALLLIGMIVLVVGLIVVVLGEPLKDYGQGGAAGGGPLTLTKTVDVLDGSGNPTGTNRIPILDGQAHRVRYRLTMTNASSSSDAANITLYDNQCGQTFTPPTLPRNHSAEVGTCEIEVIADVDRVVINEVTGTATLDGSEVQLSATGVLLIGDPQDAPPCGWPVSGTITARFWVDTGYDGQPHTGVDIGAGTNSPGQATYATINGVVKSARFEAWGGDIRIESNDRRYLVKYLHMDQATVDEWSGRVGQAVYRGQLLGYTHQGPIPVYSTGTHLHYEILVGGVLVDPGGYTPQTPELNLVVASGGCW